MLVKSDRLRILLVDGQLDDPVVFDAILEQPLPNAFASFLRRKKQHLQVPVLNAHKRDRLFGFYNDQGLHAFQRLRHIIFDTFYFRVRKKQMRRPNGPLPDIQKRIQQRLVSVCYFI